MLSGLVWKTGTFDIKQISIKTGNRIKHSIKEAQRGNHISLSAEATEGN